MPLTPAQETYHYNMAKGRVAETLIQELFLSLGYNVFRELRNVVERFIILSDNSISKKDVEMYVMVRG